MKTNQYRNNNQKNINNLSKILKQRQSQKKLDKKIKEGFGKIYPDISELGKDIRIVVTDKVNKKAQKINMPIKVKVLNNKIYLSFVNYKETPEAIVVTMTWEELDCLRDDLTQAIDLVE